MQLSTTDLLKNTLGCVSAETEWLEVANVMSWWMLQSRSITETLQICSTMLDREHSAKLD
jgi:hypothetical protein